MASLSKKASIQEFQDMIQKIYGLPNDRFFSLWDMMSNVERFMMRGLKGIRKSEKNKTRTNLLISLSWLASMMNRLHINLEKEIWNKFPYVCSHCKECPCLCDSKEKNRTMKAKISHDKKPKTIEGFQTMYKKIYPAKERTLDHAGVHLAEEVGELSEAILAFSGSHNNGEFKCIQSEAADLYSCLMGVFNSLELNVADELASMFSSNCHVCKKMPCKCGFSEIIKYKS